MSTFLSSINWRSPSAALPVPFHAERLSDRADRGPADSTFAEVLGKRQRTVTLHLDDFTRGVLHAEAVAAEKPMSTLLREWVEERLDLPVGAD